MTLTTPDFWNFQEGNKPPAGDSAAGVTSNRFYLAQGASAVPPTGVNPIAAALWGSGQYDVVIYGATPAGICAAVAASRQGASVIVIEPTAWVGGMLTGGLSHTDVYGQYTRQYIVGLADEFFAECAKEYTVTQNSFFAASGYAMSPSVAQMVLQRWIQHYQIPVITNCQLATVTKSGLAVTSASFTGIGTVYGSTWIDATYEGDLMAASGCTWVAGRESTAAYGEDRAGVQQLIAHGGTTLPPGYQFINGVDPYVTPGVSASGLLAGVSSSALASAGTADGLIQAMCYRLTWTKSASNRKSWGSFFTGGAPSGYDPKNYELLARHLALVTAAGAGAATQINAISMLFSPQSVSELKTDVNSRLCGALNYMGPELVEYVTATWDRRKAIALKIKNYTLGLLYWILYSGDSRIPAALISDMANYGFTKDEFQQYGGFSPQLYVREARRMVGDFVLKQGDLVNTNGFADGVAIGYYAGDSHVQQYVVTGGMVKAEGSLYNGLQPSPGYVLPLRMLLPKAADCSNLLSVCCPSASHVAFCTMRLEPIYMALGQAAGITAAMAAKRGQSVQTVSSANVLTAQDIYKVKRAHAVISTDGTSFTQGTITQNPGASWSSGTSAAGYIGTNYLSDGNAGKGKTLTFTPTIPEPGSYRVLVNYPAGTQYDSSRANNVPVTINHASGTTNLTLNMQSSGQGGSWDDLGVYQFNTSGGSIVIGTTGTTNYVIVSAVKLVKT